MLWTTRDIAQLAPDPATLERARPLVHARRWQSAGAIDDLLWGEFRTPGDPYLVAARISATPAFYCSCPVKRKPCKHVLALLLLAAQGSDAFTTGLEAPDWVSAWLLRLQRKREKTTAAAPQVATTDKRLAAMQAGAADLLSWLHQLIGQGLAAAEAHHEEWDRFAARLVDAKLGSIARRLRLIHAAIGTDNWPQTVLHELADLYLFADAAGAPKSGRREYSKRRPSSRRKYTHRPVDIARPAPIRRRPAQRATHLADWRTKRAVCPVTGFCLGKQRF
ncbi:MAG: SWIM zinc finger family protein [Saprospiraceae bacterium]|nr:SWIM zinc finger family protein [Saprospiraceae bacterium]